MPTISDFFGIFILMYTRDHGIAHFHVRCGGKKASIAIETGNILDGTLSPRHHRLVEQWRVLHKEELLQNWQRVREKQPPHNIMPLEG